eukprot:TRINITY_DN9767_c0_g5_i1.p1 TRINITY_DN9767_c0_g5~~TRINITY_DN9767_c0_g5_i1.p1  ORF type:complete len:375 (+),score=71.21 TRINITY_DN9767_c0_g5_i1:80-1126(+)
MAFWSNAGGFKAGVLAGDDAWTLLQHAKENGLAVPAVNCITSSCVNATLEAANKNSCPVVIQFSESGSSFFAGKGLEKDGGALLGAVAGAHYVRFMAPAYGVQVLLSSDRCPKKLLPWLDGLLEIDETFFKSYGEPLFSSHMLDLSGETDKENIMMCAKYLMKMAPMKQILEVKVGITGSYATQESVHKVWKRLSPISEKVIIAPAFGNIYGVKKNGNARLKPELLEAFQTFGAERTRRPSPYFFAFDGGSGANKQDVAAALRNGVVKMNLETDAEWAYWEGLLNFYKAKAGYLQGQIGNPDGEDKPNKSYYDPRKWVREAENSLCNRVLESCADLSTGKIVPVASQS